MRYNQKTILQAIERGVPFRFNFEARTLRLGGKTIGQDDIDTGGFAPDDPLEELEALYAAYRRSTPSRRNDARKSRYFTALPEKDLTDHDLMYGQDRDSAQGALELHVLLCILTDALDWQGREDFRGKWFWKSTNNPDLVLLRKWFTQDTKTEKTS